MSAEQGMPDPPKADYFGSQAVPEDTPLYTAEQMHAYAIEYARVYATLLRTERQQAIDALQRLSDFCKLMRMPWDQAAEAEINAVKVLESLKQEKP